jgi:hypothetical protein
MASINVGLITLCALQPLDEGDRLVGAARAVRGDDVDQRRLDTSLAMRVASPQT